MSTSLVVEVFCPQESVSANSPGAPVNRQARLQTARFEKDADLSQTIFDSASGAVVVTLSNLTASAKQSLLGGQKYRLTIEPID